MSKRFTLNTKDWKKWAINTAIFLAPAMLVFLVGIQQGKSWQESLIAVKLWAINTAVDLLRKFVEGK